MLKGFPKYKLQISGLNLRERKIGFKASTF